MLRWVESKNLSLSKDDTPPSVGGVSFYGQLDYYNLQIMKNGKWEDVPLESNPAKVDESLSGLKEPAHLTPKQAVIGEIVTLLTEENVSILHLHSLLVIARRVGHSKESESEVFVFTANLLNKYPKDE